MYAYFKSKNKRTAPTPPLSPDVEAAVERAAALTLHASHSVHIETHHLGTLLRAVRSPRLTGEQAKAAFFEGYELGNDDGRNIDVFCHIKTHKPVNDANFAWQHLSLTRAAFAGELGEVDRDS